MQNHGHQLKKALSLELHFIHVKRQKQQKAAVLYDGRFCDMSFARGSRALNVPAVCVWRVDIQKKITGRM